MKNLRKKASLLMVVLLAMFVSTEVKAQNQSQNSGVVYYTNMFPDSIGVTPSAFVTIDSGCFIPGTTFQYRGNWVQVDININPEIDSVKKIGLKFVNSTISELSWTVPKGSTRFFIQIQSDTTALITVPTTTLGSETFVQRFKFSNFGQTFSIQYKNAGQSGTRYINPFSIIATKFSQQ